jgi:flagellar biosynthesis/type III secretory pathway ATPase
MNEPVADEVRSILDGHIVMSRDLATAGHYPAINVLESVSRVMSAVTGKEHREAASRMRKVLATYEKQKDLILLGAYQSGTDPQVDYAIGKIDGIMSFLRQATDEKTTARETVEQLVKVFQD